MSEQKTNRQGSVLVCGAGITGIQTALDLANSGVKVFLVENKPTIGGMITKLDRAYPFNLPAICQIAPEMDAVSRHPNIELIANADILNIKKKDGIFEASIRKNPYRVNEKCIDCGACVQVCPIGAIKFTDKTPVQKGDQGYQTNLRGLKWQKLGYPID